jgi:hypothetical protein
MRMTFTSAKACEKGKIPLDPQPLPSDQARTRFYDTACEYIVSARMS